MEQNKKDLTKHDAALRDAIRGSLLGGAVGDALGYAVEFMNEPNIFYRYGDGGICAYDKDPRSGKALISDDTQMTLFTANGILFGMTCAAVQESAKLPQSYVGQAYQDWLRTQMLSFSAGQSERENGRKCVSWLADVPELYNRRAPGNTCMSALRQARDRDGAVEAKNHSKGCGGVMRVAPVGLVNDPALEITEADRRGASFAAITHGHPLGYMTAAVLVHILRRIVYAPNGDTLRQIVLDARDAVAALYTGNDYTDELRQSIDLAVALSENREDDLQNIHRLGEGWVAEETLAIAIYCALRHQDNFSAGVIAAVNHRGDSDSTGAVTGNILGAWLGESAIEQKWKKDLELREVLREMADDLAVGCPLSGAQDDAHPDWKRKYIDCRR